jgi:hypothetical protein
MITLIGEGVYRLIETKGQTKILTLDDSQTFAWVMAGDIGEILVASHKQHKVDHILALGAYKLYAVDDEPELTDMQHLELAVGQDRWQGYLLLTGLPTESDKRHRIIPTDEVIAGKYV